MLHITPKDDEILVSHKNENKTLLLSDSDFKKVEEALEQKPLLEKLKEFFIKPKK